MRNIVIQIQLRKQLMYLMSSIQLNLIQIYFNKHKSPIFASYFEHASVRTTDVKINAPKILQY